MTCGIRIYADVYLMISVPQFTMFQFRALKFFDPLKNTKMH
jgi:hypothetical protein